MKDFEKWSKQKKKIDESARGRLYNTREIWWCYIGLNIGHEQNGSKEDNSRPVLILKYIHKEFCFVLPLTTSKNNNKYLVPIGDVGGKEAKAIISQLKSIDTRRLIDCIGKLDKENFNIIRKAVRKFF